jgi:hypothetical protein
MDNIAALAFAIIRVTTTRSSTTTAATPASSLRLRRSWHAIDGLGTWRCVALDLVRAVVEKGATKAEFMLNQEISLSWYV